MDRHPPHRPHGAQAQVISYNLPHQRRQGLGSKQRMDERFETTIGLEQPIALPPTTLGVGSIGTADVLSRLPRWRGPRPLGMGVAMRCEQPSGVCDLRGGEHCRHNQVSSGCELLEKASDRRFFFAPSSTRCGHRAIAAARAARAARAAAHAHGT